MKSLGKFPDRFLTEIGAQPDAIRRAAAGLTDQAGLLARLPVADARTPLVFTGMGASYDACYAPVTLLAGWGARASMVDAAELLHFRGAILDGDSVLVAVSQSGESAEVVRLVERLPSRERPFLVSVTNGRDNMLARAADAALDTGAGAELGPSTLSFVASLVVLASIAEVLSGRTAEDAVAAVRVQAAEAANAAEALLGEPQEQAERVRAWLGARRTMTILGRGTARAASETGSLVLKEAARLPAEAIGAAQFRHGPLELAGPDLAVAIVATEPATAELDRGLAADLADAGSAVMVVGSGDDVPPAALFVRIGPVGRALASAVAVVPFQLLAWRLAVERGLDPGVLAIATKVTTSE